MTIAGPLPPTATRVERHSDATVNRRIRRRTDAAVESLQDASPQAIAQRLATLDREWDIERVLQANAAAISGLGLLLGRRDRRFLWLSAAVFGFFGQHALQGWCPPIPLFRRLGIRTRHEIERERHALKALRGDYDAVPASGSTSTSHQVRSALEAVDR